MHRRLQAARRPPWRSTRNTSCLHRRLCLPNIRYLDRHARVYPCAHASAAGMAHETGRKGQELEAPLLHSARRCCVLLQEERCAYLAPLITFCAEPRPGTEATRRGNPQERCQGTWLGSGAPRCADAFDRLSNSITRRVPTRSPYRRTGARTTCTVTRLQTWRAGSRPFALRSTRCVRCICNCHTHYLRRPTLLPA